MKHLIEFNLETLEVIKTNPIFEEVDETIIESTGVQEELIIEPIAIIDSDTATVIYEGALPCDREGYTKTLYFGYEDNDNNNAVVLLNKSLTVKQPIVYAVYTEIEGWFEVANQKDVENLKLQNQGVYGLGFKSGDNTVNLKTPEINLGLNDFTVELWARGEGGDSTTCIFGGVFNPTEKASMYITGEKPNGIRYIRMTSNLNNSIHVNKPDSTKNLHHIIITRSGTLVTATINGRLIKSVTQDRVLDFSKFVFDIANTTYFSIGRVFNYAMSADEVQMLWNGGRVDEVVLDRGIFYNNGYTHTSNNFSDVNNFHLIGFDQKNIQLKDGWVNITGTSSTTATRVQYVNNRDLLIAGKKYYAVFKVKNNLNKGLRVNINTGIDVIKATEGTDFNYSGIMVCGDVTTRYGLMFYTQTNIGDQVDISIKVEYLGEANCLLELLPQNIHSKGIYNTGSLGSSHDAVLSKPTETTFIKEKPYKDKQMSTGAPNFHPIAMGQKVYSDTGLIYEAAIPPTSREWSTADWKQVNNN